MFVARANPTFGPVLINLLCARGPPFLFLFFCQSLVYLLTCQPFCTRGAPLFSLVKQKAEKKGGAPTFIANFLVIVLTFTPLQAAVASGKWQWQWQAAVAVAASCLPVNFQLEWRRRIVWPCKIILYLARLPQQLG